MRIIFGLNMYVGDTLKKITEIPDKILDMIAIDWMVNGDSRKENGWEMRPFSEYLKERLEK